MAARSPLDMLAKHFAYCLQLSEEIWSHTGRTSSDVVFRTALTLYTDSSKDDHPKGQDLGNFSRVPDALDEDLARGF